MKNFRNFLNELNDNDPFNEDNWDENPIVPEDLYEFYYNNHTHYRIFNGDDYQVSPMERRDGYRGHYYQRDRGETTMFLGIRDAGNFFSHGKKYVWVLLTNIDGKKNNIRQGFYIKITTVDDYALYADWAEPITEEQLKKVVEYFDFYTELDTAENVLSDIEEIIGECTDKDFS